MRALMILLELRRFSRLACLLMAAIAWSAASSAADTGQHAADVSAQAIAAEAPFLADNDAAMSKMMDGMMAKPSGDVDRDFVEMMTPHHQGGIDMALTMLKYGHNEQLKRLAQEIIVTQQQEIAAMRLAIGDPLPPSVASPTQVAP
ncbi:MAG: conserved hypothetical exported protein [Pseudomonas sp.]|uniref:DUF305 domain-containing protein n=1 Tax=Pseudomonas sp. TaxID=306 RepID=UPI00262EF308|nr:DUF305 domain-containing protein [Pseudomonas sp.]MDB6050098.1 conserved hypothetical exported protein [Pseudomonas sp.]